MSKVYLKDVVTRIKDKVDKDNTDLEYYIGGEHFDNGEIQITKKGVIAGSTIGPAFHMRFVPGDVLLMSRNPHLRKAGVVDFEGICSDVSYVCRTKDENVLMQKFLPFIFQSDDFWRFAEENKKGSTNFFLNWSDFEKYEFNLPPIETQRKLVEILWSFENTKTAYKNLLDKTDELVKSQFIEEFGDPVDNPMGWPMRKLSDVAKVYGTMTKEYEKYADYPHIGIDSIEKNTGILSGYRTVQEDNVICPKYYFGPQHILYSKIRPALNKVALPDFEGLCSADCYPLLVTGMCDRKFLAHVMRSDYFLDYVLSYSGRSQMPKVNRKQLEGFSFPCPPIELQEKFTLLIDQSDKSKFELKQAIADIDNLARALMQQELN